MEAARQPVDLLLRQQEPYPGIVIHGYDRTTIRYRIDKSRSTGKNNTVPYGTKLTEKNVIETDLNGKNLSGKNPSGNNLGRGGTPLPSSRTGREQRVTFFS